MFFQGRFLFNLIAMVCVGGIIYGYDIGVISGALIFIQKEIPMTVPQMGYIVGAVLGGALFGTLLSGPISDYFGRKIPIQIAALIVFCGVIFIHFAHSFILVLIARLLLGVGVGMIAVCVPLYVTEIIPAKVRGTYVSLFQLLLTFGIMLAYFVDLMFTPSQNWRAMFEFLLLPCLFLTITLFFLPESPRWLLLHGKIDRANLILKQLYSDHIEFKTEVNNIHNDLIQEIKLGWKKLLKHVYLPATLAILIAVLNQLTGINAFLQYAPFILQQNGMDSEVLSMVASVTLGLINFATTGIAIFFIDRIGRRPLLMLGTFGVTSSLIYLGIVSFLNCNPLSNYLLVGFLAFILFFALGPGMVVWVAISELFPTQFRGKGIALALFFNSLASTLLSTFFLQLLDHLSLPHTFWLFAGFSFLYFMFVLIFLPETKSKTLEEIQIDFRK